MGNLNQETARELSISLRKYTYTDNHGVSKARELRTADEAMYMEDCKNGGILLSGQHRPITNSRSIDLHPMQIKNLMDYLYEFRPKLLTEAKKETNKLFFSMGTSNSIDVSSFLKIGKFGKSGL